MTEQYTKINNSLLLPTAIISLIAGIISIFKETPWYVSLPIILISALFFFIYYFRRNKYSDFDILSRNEVIDLVDRSGKIAHYTNDCLFKSLKQNAQSVKFLVQASGKIRNGKINSGIIENQTKEASTTTFKISSPRPIKKKETFNGILKCELINTFQNDNEYWEISKFSKGTNIKLTIIFPNERKPIIYKAYKVDGHKKVLSNEQPILIFENTRPALLFEVKHMTHFEKYRVEWKW